MKLTTTTLLLLFITCCSYSQNNNEKPVQKFLKFEKQITSSQEALNEFSNLYKLPKATNFKSIYSNEDRMGGVHEKFQQYLNTIKVEFGTAIVHSLNGVVTSVNGEMYQVANSNSNAVLTKDNALEKAVQHVNAKSYLWENPAEAKLMGYSKPVGELVYLPLLEKNTVVLAYKFDIYATMPISRQEIYIDAQTGKVLLTNAIIKHADKLISSQKLENNSKKIEEAISLALGTAATRYSSSKPIQTKLIGSSYVLNDETRGLGIFTYNMRKGTNYSAAVNFTDNDNNWTALEYNNANKDNGALDAHWGAGTTYDFWKNVFNRNSYDNNNAPIKSYVHYDVKFDNAFWNGSFMTYGDGNNMDVLTSLDVCAHEIGHAICTYTANLVYANQSGAMNEGFSDIWGACIEHYGRTGALTGTISPNVWKIGEDLASNPLRSMSNPLSRNDPDTYLGQNYYTGTADSGGVHTNSGVFNHWFYILTAGKAGTNSAPSPDTYNVSGIGLTKSAEIAYLAERDYLTPNATFLDARLATIAVASSLYCGTNPEVIAVTNAWYAVNVGEQYQSVPSDVALQNIAKTDLITCSETTFTTALTVKNQGTSAIANIAISYTIDGGTAVNSNWTGILNLCEEKQIPLSISGLTRGKHILTVTTTTTNDGRIENNTKSIKLLRNDAGTIGMVNSFTNESDALISYNESDNNSLWVKGIRDASNGTMSSNGNSIYTTNLTGNHPDETKAYLVSQCYNLASVTNPQISFSMKYDLEPNFDIAYVEYSTNFGLNWTVLGTKGTNWYSSDRTNANSGNADDCQNCPGAQWTGTNTTETTYSYSLTSLGNPQNVIFRIVFQSDPAANQKGVNIDNFVVTGTLATANFEIANIMIYPNPSNGIYTLSSPDDTITKLQVFDVSGKIIYTSPANIGNKKITELDLSAVSNGIYFVKIECDSKFVVKRILKQ